MIMKISIKLFKHIPKVLERLRYLFNFKSSQTVI
jgi:hypothetical protein